LAVERRILLATRSKGKLRELSGILAEAGLSGINLDDAGIEESPDEEHIECFETFEENSLAKARYFSRLSRMPTMADDSGLSVMSLGGAPGVYSKRYSGRSDLSGQDLDDANNAKLLTELEGYRDASAKYVCAAAYVDEDLEEVAIGESFGRIVREPLGSNGFGYDPYFFSAELGETFGQASTEAKQVVSHRGRAFRALVQALRRRGLTL
jgi:XTP/dITP diphosphohydrolase